MALTHQAPPSPHDPAGSKSLGRQFPINLAITFRLPPAIYQVTPPNGDPLPLCREPRRFFVGEL